MARLGSSGDKARIIALGALVVCCVGFLGGITYLKRSAAQPPVVGIRKAPPPELVAETEARKKKKILDLRDKWQVWAKAHQPQLRAMLAAQPNDAAALEAVASTLPPTPTEKKCGITIDDIGGLVNLADPVVLDISWSHGIMDAVSEKPEISKAIEKNKEAVKFYDRESFAMWHDVVITAVSSSWSKKNYYLYASGRILECEYQTPSIKQKYTTIKLPYDFLVSSKQNS